VLDEPILAQRPRKDIERRGTHQVGVEFADMKGKLLTILVVLTGAIPAAGQAQAGGAKAGIGRVFEGAARSTAARGVQQKLNGGLLKAAVAKSRTPRARATIARTPSSIVTAKRPSAAPSDASMEVQP
jgi:hypothetical protein